MTPSSAVVAVVRRRRPSFVGLPLVLLAASIAAAAAAPEAGEPRVKTFREQVATAPSPDWEGRPMPEAMKARLRPEKFRKVPTPAGGKPTFSGRVIGLT